ncbi:hypothetical protein BJY00DRAFT_322648 [Aspergillus carlsbadensis]|nr:hypothetical protein BJY00DRAFT_322648 [Aspergillus carlsbadensis]
MAHHSFDNFTSCIDLDDYDNKEIKRAVLPRTARKYDRTLALFDRFLREHPKAVSPPDIRTYKGFLVYVAKGIKGRIRDTPIPETIEGFRRDFQTAMARERGFEAPSSMSITMKEFIISELKQKLGLKEDMMPRDGLSPNDLTILLTQLWCRDFKEYHGKCPDRSRVQCTASILLYCFSSARTGEVQESTARRSAALENEHGESGDAALAASAMAACYKHFSLTIQLVDCIPMLVLTYEREFVKGAWRMKKREKPINAFYEVYRDQVPLFFNLILFMLPLFSADKAFCHYQTCTEILDALELIEPSALQDQPLKIHFREELANTPVFRATADLSCTSPTAKARAADAFGKDFAALGYRSGYQQNVTARACRQWALMEADKQYSKAARMKHAAHRESRKFGRFYAHPVCMHRNPGLWQPLPAKMEFEFQDREDMRALDEEISKLSAQLAKANDLDPTREIQLRWRRIKQQRRLQEHTRAGSVYEHTLFTYHRWAMPERDLLARILPTNEVLRSLTGRQALVALEVICKEHCQVAFRPQLKPVDGKCVCGSLFSQLGGDAFAEFCFECGVWFNLSTKWDQHFKPGLCLFCLGDETLRPVQKMEQYLDRICNEFYCGHPACTEKNGSLRELRVHLEEIHCFKPPRGKKRAAKD